MGNLKNLKKEEGWCRGGEGQILSKNLVTLVTFKRGDGVKDDKC